MFYTTLSYIKFLLKSTNQHGVHSPFVYSFVTKGLYQKKTKTNLFDATSQLEKLSKKQKKILSKILVYFKIDDISFDTFQFSKNTNLYQLLYIKNTKELKKINAIGLSSKHIIIVDHLHQTKEFLEEWQNFITNNDTIVTIDMFYFGLVFFRKEQAKEHFRIRV